MPQLTRGTLLFVLMLAFASSRAQDHSIDSLKIVLRNPKIHDTTKLASIGSLMDSKYTQNDPKYYYINNLIGALAQKNLKKKNNKVLHETYTSWLATYYNVVAIECAHKKQSLKGVAALDKSIALYKSIKAYDDANYQLIVKGSFYSIVNENEKAISCVFTALKYFEKDKKAYNGEIAYALSTLGDIYQTLENYTKAIYYYKQSVDYLNSTRTYVDSQNTYLKSVAYASIGNCYYASKQFRESAVWYEQALTFAKKTGDPSNTSIILSKLGLAKLSLKQFSEAEPLLKEALALSTHDRALAQANLAMGRLYHDQNQNGKAETYANAALALGQKTKDLKAQEQAYWLLYFVNMDKRDAAKADQMMVLRYKLLDSTKTTASKNILAQQQLKYDFEKKELHYKLESEKKNAAKNTGLIVLSAVLMLIVLAAYFYYRNNRQKQAISVLEKNQIRQKLLISQMNPHFIFNSIQNIRSLINNKQDSAAVNYLDKFSKLTRQILENSNENYISLEEELEMLENYLSIQQLLYDNKFKFNISVDDTIEAESVYLPPMLTQPFIENAIKHGLGNISEGGMIDIGFNLKDNHLYFEVADNGKGFDTDKNNSGHKSLAMKITQERLSHYTKNQDFAIQADNIVSDDGTVLGAKVQFEIPYIYEN